MMARTWVGSPTSHVQIAFFSYKSKEKKAIKKQTLKMPLNDNYSDCITGLLQWQKLVSFFSLALGKGTVHVTLRDRSKHVLGCDYANWLYTVTRIGNPVVLLKDFAVKSCAH